MSDYMPVVNSANHPAQLQIYLSGCQSLFLIYSQPTCLPTCLPTYLPMHAYWLCISNRHAHCFASYGQPIIAIHLYFWNKKANTLFFLISLNGTFWPVGFLKIFFLIENLHLILHGIYLHFYTVEMWISNKKIYFEWDNKIIFQCIPNMCYVTNYNYWECVGKVY